MARAAGMSRRTFLRRFKAGTGATPGVWLVRARLARARHLLETTQLGLDDVATGAGFGTPATLRHHFRKELKISPSNFRRHFGSPAA
jgi:AraC family transcriptional activator FtrA